MCMLTPFYMPLLFVLAGVSARISMENRGTRGFVRERVKKLLVPLLFGTLTVVAAMTYFADAFHNGYDGGFFAHYVVMFTRITDFTGYDGGFTPGHLWFLLYLFIVSAASLGVTALQRRFLPRFSCAGLPAWGIFALVLLPLATSEVLSIGGKSVVMFMTLYLIGYYVIYEDGAMDRVVRHRWLALCVALICDAACTYLFVWRDNALGTVSGICMQVARWFGILAILGFARGGFNMSGKVARYFAARSFSIYIVHFGWLVALQYYMSRACGNEALLYAVPVAGALVLTVATCEAIARVKALCQALCHKSRA